MSKPEKKKSLSARILKSYALQTLIKKFFIVWVVVTVSFLIVRGLPGNPVDIMVINLMDTQGISEDEARTRAASLLRLDLDAPLYIQYFDFLGNLVKGDLGDSYVMARGKPVTEIVFQRLPWTLFSVGTSLLISFTLGMFLGIVAAYRRNSLLDQVLSNLSAMIGAVPNTLWAIILVLLLGVVWKVVPLNLMRGSVSPGIKPGLNITFIWDVLKHWFVPGIVYVLTTLGGWMLAMRSSTVSVLGEDYVTVARARGLPDFRIITAYVGRNASLPLVTALAISIGFLLGGSTVIELIFVYQGVGFLMSQAIAKRDYPVMQGILLVTTITVIISTAIADLLYGWLDPRIRIRGEQE
ncbi:MAG: ABC transporter permease [Anaerolineales bacterium]|nr:ABC transporter permease [Anaerolineales bacterium]